MIEQHTGTLSGRGGPVYLPYGPLRPPEVEILLRAGVTSSNVHSVQAGDLKLEASPVGTAVIRRARGPARGQPFLSSTRLEPFGNMGSVLTDPLIFPKVLEIRIYFSVETPDF